MAEDKEESKGSSKINPPDVYDGNRKNFHRFWQQVLLYLAASPKHFKDDSQKIAFVLSYLRKGDADSWADLFQTQKMAGKATGADLDLGKWDAFAQDLENAFKSEYAEQDAINDLNNLVMKRTTTGEDHVAHFKTLVIKSGLKSDPDLMAKFQRSVTPRLRRIISYKGDPTTLKEWYQACITADNTDRRISEDIDRFNRQNPKPTTTPTRTTKYYNASNNYSNNNYRQPYRDPNAMDVDAINLSPEERSKRLKQGACFTCGELGHRAKDHFDPNFKAKGTTTNRPYIARTGNQTGNNRSGSGPPRSTNIAQQIRGLSEIDKAKLYRETFGADNKEDEDLPFPQ